MRVAMRIAICLMLFKTIEVKLVKRKSQNFFPSGMHVLVVERTCNSCA